MNRAIWYKAFADAWLPLLVSCLLLSLFAWLFVWLMSLFQIGAWAGLLNLMPDVFRPLLGVPVAKLATPTGQLSVLYAHIVTTLLCAGWAVGRGSGAISGEIGHGRMDVLLALPIRRATVIFAPGVVATLGAALLAMAVQAGIGLGLMTVTLTGEVSFGAFLPGTINLFCMTFCFLGITLFFSSWNADRWRAVSLAGGFFVVSLILKIVANLWPKGDWLAYTSFLSGFVPQRLILLPDEYGTFALSHNLPLLGVGLLGFLAATVIFGYRDVPTGR